MAYKLKLDSNNNVVMQEGKIVVVDDIDGKDVTVDVEQQRVRIAELNNESKSRRLKIEAQDAILAKYGTTTPEEAVAALDAFKELGGADGIAKLKEKGKIDVDAVKRSITDAYEGKLKTANDQLASKDQTIYDLLVGNALNNSPFVKDKLRIPVDMVLAKFKDHFKVENGKVVAYFNGQQIISKEKPGEFAGVDESMAFIVDQYPFKEQILRGANSSGGGAGDGSKTFGTVRSRADLKSPKEKSAFIKEHGLDAFKALPEK